MGSSDEPDEMPLPDSESVCVIPGSVLLWKITPRPQNSTQVKKNLACLLLFLIELIYMFTFISLWVFFLLK